MSKTWTILLVAAGLAMPGLLAGCAAGTARKGAGLMGTFAAHRALDPVAFMSGTRREWRDGALIEEAWSPAHGRGMLGHFRWVRANGAVMIYELLSLSCELVADGEEVVLLRIRHFSAALVAMEEKDAPMTLRLARTGPGEAEFVAHAHCGDVARIVYRDGGGGVLHARVEFAAGSGRGPLEFAYRPD